MKHTAVNPYLPLYEYVPDGEPRLFDGRVYLYGSHDTAGGDFFCLEDYVAWSAPEDDLGDWRYEGVIYRKDQDPSNPDGKLELFAPDVVQGPDGHYYLYCLRMRREFGVAVSDSPAGPFAFYSHIQKPDGSVLEDAMPYDPSVLVDEDGKIYLYYGFASEMLGKKYGFVKSPGAMMVQLDSDMRTAVTEPVLCIPGEDEAPGTSFAGHAYVEARSMRRFGDLYYFVYSSQRWHELCYAVSSRPDGGFIYGGVIVDNADLGLNGRTLPVCMPGNNHGGLIQAGGKCYMFYHRHTNCTSFSRQGCAEQVQLLPGGRIPQVEVTSCGLNGGPLPAEVQHRRLVSTIKLAKRRCWTSAMWRGTRCPSSPRRAPAALRLSSLSATSRAARWPATSILYSPPRWPSSPCGCGGRWRARSASALTHRTRPPPPKARWSWRPRIGSQ